eukprot:Platyproteum_vivax@DN7071_c1_g1_i1.p1
MEDVFEKVASGLYGGAFGSKKPQVDFRGPHIANTYTGLVCLWLVDDDLSRLDTEGIENSLKHWQRPDGSFTGLLPVNAMSPAFPVSTSPVSMSPVSPVSMVCMESDMRFIFCGAVIASLIGSSQCRVYS